MRFILQLLKLEFGNFLLSVPSRLIKKILSRWILRWYLEETVESRGRNYYYFLFPLAVFYFSVLKYIHSRLWLFDMLLVKYITLVISVTVNHLFTIRKKTLNGKLLTVIKKQAKNPYYLSMKVTDALLAILTYFLTL